MRITKTTKLGMVAALASIMLFSLGGVAFAADGPTPPKAGDPVGADISPHGGYSTSSNYCLQCHEVHNAAGDYALLASTTVTATCNTCHGLPVLIPGGPGSPRQPLEPANPAVPGTASQRAAYTVTTGRNAMHGIGSSSPPGESGITMTLSDWNFDWTTTGPPGTNASTGANTVAATNGGLYCASCHTPHGDFGQLANANKVLTSDSAGANQAVANWAENTVIWWDDPDGTPEDWRQVALHYDSSSFAGGLPSWEVCDLNGGAVQTPTAVANALDTVAVGTCSYAQVYDTDGQLVSLYGYKLLSEFPNHTYSSVKSWGTDIYTHDGAKWCGTCHPSRLDTSFGGTFHNHPTGCQACHGNPSGTAAGAGDFPHTSANADFLVQYPDALCISCHTGGLP